MSPLPTQPLRIPTRPPPYFLFLHSHSCLRVSLLHRPPRPLSRPLSTLPRPYTFHIGLAYSRKPPDTSQPLHYRMLQPSKTFPRFSDKGRWRDGVLREWEEGWVGREQAVREAEESGKGRGRGGDREHAMGEDFLFVQPMRGGSGVALGIADGVGGWSASGVDPSLFSQSMMYHSSVAARRGWAFPPDLDGEHDTPPSPSPSSLATSSTPSLSPSLSASSSDSDHLSLGLPTPEAEHDTALQAQSDLENEAAVLFRGDGWNALEGAADLAPAEDGVEQEEEELAPKEILQRGYDAVLRDPDVEMGASTACLITLNAKTGRLRAANLGDSGFLVIRGAGVQHIQKAQTHYFNCPKQLSKYPHQAFRKGNRPILDQPSEADEWECTLRHGDVVLLYTDGLSDNVFPSQLLDLSLLAQAQVARTPSPSSPSSSAALYSSASPAGDELQPPTLEPSDPLSAHYLGETEPEPAETTQAKRLARMCVEHARKAMGDVGSLTPFEVAAKTEGGWEWWDWIGGKIDDVTVIAVVVTEGM